jgi:chromate transporter
MRTPDRPVALVSLYGLFFVVGLCSFGGGVTAWFHREVVLARKWMTDDEFFSGYSLAQVLPGVNSTNMAVYIGQHLRGAIGAAVALSGLLTGPFFIVIAAAVTYNLLLEIPGFAAAMAGIATTAVGMIFRMGLTSAKDSLHHVPSAVILVATLLAVGILQWPLVPVILVLAPLSIAAAWRRNKSKIQVPSQETSQQTHHSTDASGKSP